MIKSWILKYLGISGYGRLCRDVTTLENALERARLLGFVRVVKYTKCMDLTAVMPEPPISVVKLDARIAELERKVG